MESMESGRICVEEFVVECKKLAAANSSLTWMSLDEDEDYIIVDWCVTPYFP
eukprot:m.143556 g.143556  ORF g.143556 m.143556 type:complete len:52 (-) comp13207_c0_seq11:1896-2051(-)